jgi:hypothetical protein
MPNRPRMVRIGPQDLWATYDDGWCLCGLKARHPYFLADLWREPMVVHGVVWHRSQQINRDPWLVRWTSSTSRWPDFYQTSEGFSLGAGGASESADFQRILRAMPSGLLDPI